MDRSARPLKAPALSDEPDASREGDARIIYTALAGLLDEGLDLLVARAGRLPASDPLRGLVELRLGRAPAEVEADAIRLARAREVVVAAILAAALPRDESDQALELAHRSLVEPSKTLDAQRAEVVKIVARYVADPALGAVGSRHRTPNDVWMWLRCSLPESFATLPFEVVERALRRVSDRPGGANRRGVYGACAEIGLAVEAFGDKRRRNEAPGTALERVTGRYREAERRAKVKARAVRAKR